MTPRIFPAALLLVLCSSILSHAQSPPSEIDDLLRQVASKCRELYRQGYAVDIRRRRIQRPHFGEAGQPGGNRIGLPIPLPPGALSIDGQVEQIKLARSGRHLRYEVRNVLGPVWDWWTDEQTIWCYRPVLGLYTETRADPWPTRLGPGPGLPGIEWKYFTKFLAIDDMRGHASIVKDDVDPDSSCHGPSVVVELKLSGRRNPATEDLRILTRSRLPCQTVIHWLRRGTLVGADTDSTDTIAWSFQDRPPAPAVFVFTPPKNAKRVTKFPVIDDIPHPVH
ncbi:MAG: hypothetical protein ABI165_17805 [Bryobacteraceae bacterium]